MTENVRGTGKPDELTELERTLEEVYELRYAARSLEWDQWTLMPESAAEDRGRQLAAVQSMAHERFTDPRVGELLEELKPLEEGCSYNAYEASLARVTRREYEREKRKPSELVRRLAEHSGVSYAAWVRSKRENNFEIARPHLERSLDLSLEMAECLRDGDESHADTLLALADPGLSAEKISGVFSELRTSLAPLARRLAEEPPPDDSCLQGRYQVRDKLAFAEEVIGRLGYDFSRGRHDLADNPFMSRLSANDVRVVTWEKEGDLRRPLFASLHEAGHALYEQGVSPQFAGTPLGEGNSTSLHESQSRLFENVVGRSRPFWEFFYSSLQKRFPNELGCVSLDTFCRAINLVRPSLIRTQADEVTYNLHVVMRFDFELALLKGDLAVRDLPEAWRERMRKDLGIVPEDDREGCLQDPHWYDEGVGGLFHGYALGNLLAAQFYAAALREHPDVPAEMAAGEFGALRGWLSNNVWRHGGKLTAEEVVEEATGSPIAVEPFVGYLRSKYGELYGISL